MRPTVIEIRCDCQHPRVPFDFRTMDERKERECNFCRRLFIVRLNPGSSKEKVQITVTHINNFEFIEQPTPREWWRDITDGE